MIGAPREATLLQRLQLLAGFETHRFAGRNSDLGASARVAADAGFAWTHVEDPEAAQLNALAVRQGPLHALENSFHGHLGLGLGDAGFVDHFVDDVELDHGLPLAMKPERSACGCAPRILRSPQGGSKPHDRIRVRVLSSSPAVPTPCTHFGMAPSSDSPSAIHGAATRRAFSWSLEP